MRMRLRPHPESSQPAPFEGLFGLVRRSPGGLFFEYEIRGLREPLKKWPPRFSAPQRRDELWKSTCFEAFLKPQGEARYWELNFSAEGEWNCYSFSGRRQGMQAESRVFAPVFSTETRAGSQLLRVEMDLPKEMTDLKKSLQVSLTTVVENLQGEVSYWALSHPRGRPDFHDPEHFTLSLEAE